MRRRRLWLRGWCWQAVSKVNAPAASVTRGTCLNEVGNSLEPRRAIRSGSARAELAFGKRDMLAKSA